MPLGKVEQILPVALAAARLRGDEQPDLAQDRPVGKPRFLRHDADGPDDAAVGAVDYPGDPAIPGAASRHLGQHLCRGFLNV